MTTAYEPHGNNSCYCFPYPQAIVDQTGTHGLTLPIREVFEMIARDIESKNPRSAEFYRSVAAYYPHCDDAGHEIERDTRGDPLPDLDDWDELSDEEKLTRGNINATIAILDRLRFDLEKMNDDPDNNNEVNEIRRGLAAIIEDRW
ncbi:hypothetical protein [Rhizobium halophilum]|uniref:hypothetical protein n=1 Tax=Rhizobium halophilum TaxID=2846852 RepID=UPI001EFE1508|nr:hypothetical protein [Rhizobium halophilum]MCF6369497.1 hypothetical protein [Rhizobium halophilum]